MVHAQAVDHAGMHQLQNQPMGIVEDLFIFDAHADQSGDFKKRR